MGEATQRAPICFAGELSWLNQQGSTYPPNYPYPIVYSSIPRVKSSVDTWHMLSKGMN